MSENAIEKKKLKEDIRELRKSEHTTKEDDEKHQLSKKIVHANKEIEKLKNDQENLENKKRNVKIKRKRLVRN